MRKVYHRATATVTQIVVGRLIFQFVNQLCFETEWSRRHTIDPQMAVGVVLQDIHQFVSSTVIRVSQAPRTGDPIHNLTKAHGMEMNRMVRTRTPGGVGGASGNPGPYHDRLFGGYSLTLQSSG